MGIRKNAKFLSAPEREDLVRAFVMMKADVVNPSAPLSDQYSRWEEFVAVHWYIQNVNMPGFNNVNFGHGGTNAYGFLPWHRYFLYLLEQRLQSHVPGVMLPYWDWTDPTSTLFVEDFLGPNGTITSNWDVLQGYFARDPPGTGVNTTPMPSWWPAGLDGWNLHPVFGSFSGALRRRIGSTTALPTIASIRSALSKPDYPQFQNALESGFGVSPSHGLHNSLHVWFGSVAHMWSVQVSPFDPMFYLHHCNIDRLWAMWQMDGHMTDYPIVGGNAGHNRNDPMYPWIGNLAGYSTNNLISSIDAPDFSSLGIVTPADVLDHRSLGYSYDTQVIMGIALDRTGSMTGMTPDPMTASAPDVTKWEAAKRGIAAFLQDCEVAYESAEAYILAGIKTFRRLGSNDFSSVFTGVPYGLVKLGSTYSRADFETAVSTMNPGGSTPLADALLDVNNTLVIPPFGSIPSDERRYLVLFTDGLLTSGSPLSSIANGSLSPTSIFAMGFGTGTDVDYTTLSNIVSKGSTITNQQGIAIQQVFHGENAGVIDKFYSQALAAAIGFTPIMDPVLELFDGEHTHLNFSATSAEDAFFLTVQGMDFDSSNWSYQLIGPDGGICWTSGDLPGHTHGGEHCSCHRKPHVVARTSNGRLSLFLTRDSASSSSWVGEWNLMIGRRARNLAHMVMLSIGYLLVPVGASPLRGPRFTRLLKSPRQRTAVRAIPGIPKHRLDENPTSSNQSQREACSVAINVYGRTRLRVSLNVDMIVKSGHPVDITVNTETLRGTSHPLKALSRLVAPQNDLMSILDTEKIDRSLYEKTKREDDGITIDAVNALVHLEEKNPALAEIHDEEIKVVSDHDSKQHLHIKETSIPGIYRVSTWIQGTYDPGTSADTKDHHDDHKCRNSKVETYSRLISTSMSIEKPKNKT